MKNPKIIIDGVIFQIQRKRPAGISRVWLSLLQELSKSRLADNILLLDRDGTIPEGIKLRKKVIPKYSMNSFEADSLLLEEIVQCERGALFISTYYSYPENSPCMIMLHDMTPEIMAFDQSHPEWRAKGKAIVKSFAYFSVSEATMGDFRRLYPEFGSRPVYIVPNAVSDLFRPRSAEEITHFKRVYGIRKPYFLLCGHRPGYKNVSLFFHAFSLLDDREGYEILCTGGGRELEPQFREYLGKGRCHLHFLNDNELSIAMAGAQAVVYPSLYEGFGLPLLEGMKSGSPIITCPNSSIPEVVGDAALFVDGHDIEAMKRALLDIRDTSIRTELTNRGFRRAALFSWERSGRLIVEALQQVLEVLPRVKANQTDPIDTASRFYTSLLAQQGTREFVRYLIRSIAALTDQKSSLDFSVISQIEESIIKLIPDQIIPLLRETIKTGNCDAFMHYWYALILESQGMENEALAQYLLAIERGLNTVRVAYRTAKLAQRLDHVITACDIFEELLDLFPGFDEVGKALKDLNAARELVRESMALVAIKLNAPPTLVSVEREQMISVILPTKGRPGGLEEILESLPAAMGSLSYEVLLYVGDDDHAETRTIITTHGITRVFYDADIFSAGEKFSWAKLVNHGFRNARGKWIIFASDDIVFFPEAFPQAVSAAKDDEKIGGVTFLHRNTIEDHGGIFREFGYDCMGIYPFINFGIIRKSAFSKTSGFDESYRFYWADVDICMQLWQAGFSIIPSPYSLVDHNNIVDSMKKGNSKDIYYLDTRYFLGKWKVSSLFKGKNVLAKQRFSLTPVDSDKVINSLNGISGMNPHESLNASDAFPASGEIAGQPHHGEIPVGVNFTGFFNGEFGVGVAARNYAHAFTSASIPHSLHNLAVAGQRFNDRTFTDFAQDNPYLINLVHVNADLTEAVTDSMDAGFFSDRYNIGLWVWELERFPEQWHRHFERYHEIWVPSEFCRQAVAAVSPIPVVTMPHPIVLDQGKATSNRKQFTLPGDEFVFLFVFDYLSVFQRKNPLAVIEAFKSAFSRQDKATLVIKCINAHYSPEKARLLEESAKGGKIRFINQHLDNDDMLSLMASADSFVSLHRSEGFGLGMAQSMYLGKPVIATAYSGNMDFMTGENSFPVNYRLVELENDYGPYAKGNFWAEPDLNHAAELMRLLFNRRDLAANRAEIAARDIKEKLNPETIGARLEQRVREIHTAYDKARSSTVTQGFTEPGRKLKQERRYDEALADLWWAKSFGERSVLTDIGDCLASLGKAEAALLAYSDAIKEEINPLRTLLGIGRLKLKQEKFTEAAISFSKALRLNPEECEALLGLASARKGQGRHPECLNTLLKALDLYLNDRETLHEILVCAARLDKTPEVSRYIEEHFQTDPEQPADLADYLHVESSDCRYDLSA
jgi:glycosyltransferase involved in cell wall biosynthesis/GT2 family glycosyltransferase